MSEQNSNSENNLLVYRWTHNVIEKSKFHGIEKRNLAEAIIVPFVVSVVILSIPFTRIVKIMTLIVILPTLFTVFVKGYKNRSIFEFIRDEIRFKKRRRVLHLRGVEYKRKKGAQYTDYEEYGFVKSVIEKSKQKLTEFIEKYDADDTGKDS